MNWWKLQQILLHAWMLNLLSGRCWLPRLLYISSTTIILFKLCMNRMVSAEFSYVLVCKLVALVSGGTHSGCWIYSDVRCGNVWMISMKHTWVNNSVLHVCYSLTHLCRASRVRHRFNVRGNIFLMKRKSERARVRQSEREGNILFTAKYSNYSRQIFSYQTFAVRILGEAMSCEKRLMPRIHFPYVISWRSFFWILRIDKGECVRNECMKNVFVP